MNKLFPIDVKKVEIFTYKQWSVFFLDIISIASFLSCCVVFFMNTEYLPLVCLTIPSNNGWPALLIISLRVLSTANYHVSHVSTSLALEVKT